MLATGSDRARQQAKRQRATQVAAAQRAVEQAQRHADDSLAWAAYVGRVWALDHDDRDTVDIRAWGSGQVVRTDRVGPPVEMWPACDFCDTQVRRHEVSCPMSRWDPIGMDVDEALVKRLPREPEVTDLPDV